MVGCSYRGQPTTLSTVRNLMGCNMAVRRTRARGRRRVRRRPRPHVRRPAGLRGDRALHPGPVALPRRALPLRAPGRGAPQRAGRARLVGLLPVPLPGRGHLQGPHRRPGRSAVPRWRPRAPTSARCSPPASATTSPGVCAATGRRWDGPGRSSRGSRSRRRATSRSGGPGRPAPRAGPGPPSCALSPSKGLRQAQATCRRIQATVDRPGHLWTEPVLPLVIDVAAPSAPIDARRPGGAAYRSAPLPADPRREPAGPGAAGAARAGAARRRGRRPAEQVDRDRPATARRARRAAQPAARAARSRAVGDQRGGGHPGPARAAAGVPGLDPGRHGAPGADRGGGQRAVDRRHRAAGRRAGGRASRGCATSARTAPGWPGPTTPGWRA